MSYIALAIGGSALIGAAASKSGSKDVAQGQKKGMEQSLALTSQARQDVMKLFERSATNSGMGMKAALDYYKTAAPKRLQPYMQGSQQAQQVIGQGAVQANNAILGLPVDMGFVNQPQIVPGTDHMIGAQIPQFEQGGITSAHESGITGNSQAGAGSSSNALGSNTSAKDLLTGNFSIGGNSSIKKKLDKLSPSKRLIKKLF